MRLAILIIYTGETAPHRAVAQDWSPASDDCVSRIPMLESPDRPEVLETMAFGQGDRAEAGLPQADDYDPDAIGTAMLSAGEAEQTWPEYGLEMVPLLHGDARGGDAADTGRRLIRRNGDFIADVTDSYQLLPNEEVVMAANEVADELGAIPFHEWEREGDRNDGWYVKLDDHVYQDTQRRRIHALYAFESGTVGDDEMEYGIAVHNSIDGSLAFNIALFSFRHACANLTHIGIPNSSLNEMAQNVEDEREVHASASHRHTSGLDVNQDALQTRIKAALTFVDDVHDTYESWRDDAVSPEFVEGLIDRFPHKDLPVWMQDISDEIEQEREDREAQALSPSFREELIEDGTPSDVTSWEAYNDMTEAIWHDDRTQDTSKQSKMRNLHRVMPVLD